MFLVVSFDLPSVGAGTAKRYRELRKSLAACGFSAVQKSVAWRWCEDREHRDAVIARILKHRSDSGDLLFFSIPDEAFRNTVRILDGAVKPPPEPPAPWTIFA